jgi:hypothetical protein
VSEPGYGPYTLYNMVGQHPRIKRTQNLGCIETDQQEDLGVDGGIILEQKLESKL